MKFNELINKEEILKAISDDKYENPTNIQSKIIPLIKEGSDVLGQSKTGTGKTLAFAASILDTVETNRNIQALILAPTRELALQISEEINNLGKYTKIFVTCVYGNSSIEEQIKHIKKGTEIVVGTPGRVKDLINRRILNLEDIKFFVLDEADEMLSMGFKEELEYIFEHTNKNRQVMMFSATMPKAMLTLAEKYMKKNYKYISVVTETKTADHVEQEYYVINDKTRVEAMVRIMDYYNPKKAIIFCRTKRNADDVLERITKRGYLADIIHGDITQSQRIATLERFKSGTFNYLIATDVAARGIHVDDVEVVFNYNLPESNEAYVHRIGRTGRVDKSGIAVTFIRKNEEDIIVSVENHVNALITKKELPTMNDIISSRLDDATNIVNEFKEDENDKYDLKKNLSSLKKDELINVINHFLTEKLENSLGSDFSVDVTKMEKKKKTKRNPSEDAVRIFLTIGKLDKIDKRDLLSFIEKKANVKEGVCTGVEILSKFTFMNVKKDSFDKIFNSVNNSKYHDRVIRIEKAKK